MDVVHDRVTIEVLRGCTRGCRFCQAGMVYRPVRERPADAIVREVHRGAALHGLRRGLAHVAVDRRPHASSRRCSRRLSAASEGAGVAVSLPSLRVDSFGVEIARRVCERQEERAHVRSRGGYAATADVINKNVTEDELLETVDTAFAAGWRRVKLYFMIGLPTETDDDVGRSACSSAGARRGARGHARRRSVAACASAVSVSTFVPKAAHAVPVGGPATRRDGSAAGSRVLRESMPRKGVELSWHDAETSFL